MLENDRRLIGDIPRVNGPVLVIGGGPTVLTELALLRSMSFEPAAVLSANEHGHLQDVYPITYSVCCDPTHGVRRENMEDVLRKYGQPIITQCHFGDFRIPSWKVAANTGLTAILVGAMIGGLPVVPVGMGFYRIGAASPGDQTYFHHADKELKRDSHGDVSNSNRKNKANFDKQIERVKGALRHFTAVRPLQGMLTAHYPKFDPHEKPGRGAFGPMLDWTMQRKTLILYTGHKRSKRVVLSTGCVEFERRIPVDEDEAVRLINSYGGSKIVWPQDHPLVGHSKGKARHPDLLPPPPDRWPELL